MALSKSAASSFKEFNLFLEAINVAYASINLALNSSTVSASSETSWTALLISMFKEVFHFCQLFSTKFQCTCVKADHAPARRTWF